MVFYDRKVFFPRKDNKKAVFDEEISEKSPVGVYLHSREKEASISFTKPVKLSSFYLRKHDFTKYQSETKGKSQGILFKVKGSLKNEELFDVDFVSKVNYNAWV